MKRLCAVLSIFFAIFVSFNSYALTDFDRAEFRNQNALAAFNPGFESGKAAWTCSPTININSTANDQFVSNSKSFATWDSTSSGQSCYSTLVKVPTTGTCESSLTIQNPSGGTHLFLVNDGTNTVSSKAIDSQTTAVQNRLVYPCPASGTVKIGLLSVAANEPVVNFDNAWTGKATSVVNSSFAQPVKSFTPTGSWTSNTAYAGRWWRVNDRAHFEIQVTTSGAPTSAALTVNFGSICTADTSKLTTTTRNDVVGTARVRDDSATTVWNGSVRYDTTTTVAVLSESASTPLLPVTQAVPMTWAANDTVQLNFSIPCDGWTASDAVTADSQRPPRVVHFTSGSGTYIPSPGVTYIHVTLHAGGGGGGGAGSGVAGGPSTFAGVTAAGGNPGTNGAAGNGSSASGTLPAGGFRVIPNVIGNSGHPPSYTTGGNGGANCQGAGAGKASDAYVGGTGVTNTGGGGAGGGTSTAAAIGGGGGGAGGCDSFFVINPVLSGYSWSVGTGGGGNAGSGSNYAGAAGGSGIVTVIEYFGAVSALLANSVSVGATTGSVEFFTNLTCSSSSSLSGPSEPGATIGNISSGACVITFPSGRFTREPSCTVTWNSGSSLVGSTSNVSMTSVDARCAAASGGTACTSAYGSLVCRAVK